MTWEVYGDFQAPYEDCFRMFNPSNSTQFGQVVEAWTAAVFALIAKLPGHPSVPELQYLAGGSTPLGGAGLEAGGAGARSSRRFRKESRKLGGGATAGLQQGPNVSGVLGGTAVPGSWLVGGLAAGTLAALLLLAFSRPRDWFRSSARRRAIPL